MRPGLPVAGLLVLLCVLPVVAMGAMEESRLRTVELRAPPEPIPGPLIAVAVALVGTLVVTAARLLLEAARRPRPAA